MIEILWSLLLIIARAINFVWDVVLFHSHLRKLARMWTGSDKLVAVPAKAKVLSPAARRVLAEAEQRNHFLYLPRK